MSIIEKTNEKISIAVVEDDQAMCEYLKKEINCSSQLSFAFSSDTVKHSITKLQRSPPTVILIDLGLLDGCGSEIIRYISEYNLPTKAIVLTAFSDEKHVVRAISAGAVGYLLKHEPSQTIEKSILQMLDGGSPISPKIARDILSYFQSIAPPQEEKTSTRDKEVRLTKRETEVLRKIAKGYTCQEISEMESLSYHTIVTHVRNIYKKLSVSSRAAAVFEAHNLRLI